MDPRGLAVSFKEKLEETLSRTVDAVSKNLSQILQDIDQYGANYYIIGGLAVSHHGWPRTTHDIDIIMNADDFAKLEDNDAFEISGKDKMVGKMLHKPSGMRIDVIQGGKHRPTLDQLSPSPYDDRIVSVEDLIWLKTFRGDPSDYGDIYKIIQSGTKINWDVVKSKITPAMFDEIQKLIDYANI